MRRTRKRSTAAAGHSENDGDHSLTGDQAGPARSKRTRRSQVTITGGIVPPGELRPHDNHPLRHLSPEERLEAAYEALGNLILNLIEKKISPAEDK